MPSETHRDRKEGDLHIHIEGAVTIDDVQAALSVVGVGLRQETVSKIKSLYEKDSGESTLIGFISRLSTRWIRLGLLAIYDKHKRQPEMIKSQAKLYLETLVKLVITRAQTSGHSYFNLLFSAWNMSSGYKHGDLGQTKIDATIKALGFHTPPNSEGKTTLQLEEEKELYASYKQHLDAYKNNDPKHDADKTFLSTSDYMQVMHKGIQEALQDIPEEKRMKVTTTLSFRRDADLKMIENDAPDMDAVVDAMEQAFVHGWIDCVDLCGNEASSNFLLSRYKTFLLKLEKRGIPYSIHLGEVKGDPQTKHIVEQNLQTFLELRPILFAHGLRLTDDTPLAREARVHAHKHHIVWVVCLSSNEMTGAMVQTNIHDAVAALVKNPELFEKLLITFGSDDPVVIYPLLEVGKPVAAEIAMFVQQLETAHVKLDQKKDNLSWLLEKAEESNGYFVHGIGSMREKLLNKKKK